MPSPRPPYIADHYYHIYNRGANRSLIFVEDENYLFALRKIKKYSRKYSITIIAYCLMPNHYHFLVRQDGEEPAGLLPQRVFNSYSKYFNNHYERSGTLFEGPYRVIHVKSDTHLVHLCRYIHANPVKDRLVANLGEWTYSNYAEWIGIRSGTLVDRTFINEHFAESKDYAKFVFDFAINRCLPDEIHTYIQKWDS